MGELEADLVGGGQLSAGDLGALLGDSLFRLGAAWLVVERCAC